MDKDKGNKNSGDIKTLIDSGLLDGLTKMNDDNIIIGLFKANEPQIINEVDEVDEVDETKNKKIIDNWDRTGLLDSLDNEQKIIIAQAFEELARQLTSPFFNDAGFHCLEMISFPIVRRILCKNDNYKKLMPFNNNIMRLFINKLIIDLKDELNKQSDLFQKTNELHDNGIDPEAAFCAEFCKNYELSENYK